MSETKTHTTGTVTFYCDGNYVGELTGPIVGRFKVGSVDAIRLDLGDWGRVTYPQNLVRTEK